MEFQTPPIAMTTMEHIHLVELWEKCSPCAGFCIELGERFFIEGVAEVDATLIPMLQSKADKGISPRVIPSYAILYWFAQQVHALVKYFMCVHVVHISGKLKLLALMVVLM